MVGPKRVLKIVRLSPESINQNYIFRGPTTPEQMWKEFLNRSRSKVDQWKPLAHENVVRILGVSDMSVLHVEHYAHGTASQYLAEHPRDPILLRRKMIGDVLAGLEYLHSRSPPIVHGCIRMDKLYVDIHGTTKIGEFCLAYLAEGFGYYAPAISNAGLVRWKSPEQLESALPPVRTGASDIWALGCTLFEIMSGKLPYYQHEHDLRICTAVASNDFPGDLKDLLDPDFHKTWLLVTSCWESTPDQRPSVDHLRTCYTLQFPPPHRVPVVTVW